MTTHHHYHKTITQKDVMEKIEQHLLATRGRMTPVRREVAAAMTALREPKTAYQLLAILNKKRRQKLSAISLYRTLEFLMDAGVALKLESRNAYEICLNDAPEHSHLLMICDTCGAVREMENSALTHALAKSARDYGHILKHHAIELHGACKRC